MKCLIDGEEMIKGMKGQKGTKGQICEVRKSVGFRGGQWHSERGAQKGTGPQMWGVIS